MSSNFFRDNPPVSYQGARWYKLPDSTDPVHLRFLPAIHGATKSGRLVWYHYGVHGIRKIFCFSTYELECPLCSLLEEIEKSPWLQSDVLKKKRTSKSFFNVLVLGDRTNRYKYSPTTPCLLGVPGTDTFDWLSSLQTSTSGDITDRNSGRSVRFQREYRKGNVRRVIDAESKPLAPTEKDIQGILDRAYDLQKVWPAPDHHDHLRMSNICEMVQRYYQKFSW